MASADAIAHTTFDAVGVGRRRVPRRAFEAAVGILLHGNFTLQRSYQVGEGGMMISASQELVIGELMVINFHLPGSGMVMVRALVRSVHPAHGANPVRYGVEFTNLDFTHKRGIRNFVAASTRSSAYSSSSLP